MSTTTRTREEVMEGVRRLVLAATGEEYGDGRIVSDYGVGIAEPGYGDDQTVWVMGNWNPARFVSSRDPEPLKVSETVGPRLARALERLGVELLWLDEWTTCDECLRVFRIEADSYGWQMHGALTENGAFCRDHALEDVEWLVLENGYLNNSNVALVMEGAAAKLEEVGYVKYNEQHSYEAGWYDGQTDDPKAIELKAEAEGWTERVFAIDYVGQFDTHFSLYVRNREDEEPTRPRIYRTWVARLEGDVLSRGLIGQFVKSVGATADGYEAGGATTNLSERDAYDLAEMFKANVRDRGGYQLEPRHIEFGLEWLEKNHAKVMHKFATPDDYQGFEQVITEDPFRFVGWEHYGRGYGVTSVPVYTVRYRKEDGSVGTWTYHWINWQANAYG